MSIHYEDQLVTLHHGDCLDVLRGIPDASIDSVVCDPPYGLSNTDPAHVADTIVHWVNGERDYLPPVRGGGFMGNAWDSFVPPVAVWDDCYRVLKPGGHVLTFAGSRTHDLMALGVRLAGFDVRDSIAWLYGSGFPKSLDVSKAIDKGAGVEREVVAVGSDGATRKPRAMAPGGAVRSSVQTQSSPATPDAEQWQGWGTALKPAFEPIVVGRKPLDGTVAANVLEHGTGALNIDACRVGDQERVNAPARSLGNGVNMSGGKAQANRAATVTAGRWPTNVVLDGDQADELDEQSGDSTSRVGKPRGADSGDGWGMTATGAEYEDAGGASRFFPVFRYEAKAPTSQRPKVDGVAHPTVKPLDLMR